MAKRSQLMVMVAVSIVILFLVSGFSAMAYGSGPGKSVSASGTSGNVYKTNITSFTQDSDQNNPGGYVKYTLDLLNNSLINGNFVIAVGGIGPAEVAYDPSNGYLYVTNVPNNVSVINGANNTVIASIPVGFESEPWGVAYDPSNGYVYVTNLWSGTVSVINGANNTVIASIPVGFEPRGVAYDPSNGYVYVANSHSANVLVINGANNTVIASIPVIAGPWGESEPWGVAYDPSNGYVYVTDYGSANVLVINGANNTVIASIPVGSGPAGVAYDPSNGYVYVANSLSDSVSVINGANNTVIASIPVGSWPTEVAYDPSNGYVYVTNWDSDNVSVINGANNTVIASIPVGLAPRGVAYDPSNGYVYVANYGSATVSIISTSTQVTKMYSVTFTESGLPTGTQWSVTLNGETETSTTNTISFTEPNGAYSFSISSINGYSVSPSSGSITVNGASVNQAITFTAVTPSVYTITFTESGLPTGTQWSVTLNGVTNSSTANSITFTGVLAGNYAWNASSIIAVGSGTRYAAQTSSGTVSVPTATSVSLYYVEQYSVTVGSTAGGSASPSGTSWYNAGSTVNITAIPASGYKFAGWETNSSITFTNSSSSTTNAMVNSAGTIVASFKAVPSSTQPSYTVPSSTQPSYTMEYAAAAAVVVIVILVAVLLMRRRGR